LPRRARRARVEMRHLLQRVDARVRPAGAVHDDALVGDPGYGVGDRGLDAALPALSLPAEELAAVVLDSERDPRHRETGRRSAPQAPRSLSGERVDQTLRLAALPGVALVEHFLEDAARTLRIAH